MNKFFLLGVLAILPIIVMSQRHTATFENGTKVDYDIITTKFTDSKRFNLRGGAYVVNLDLHTYLLGASYYMPNKFLLGVHYQPSQPVSNFSKLRSGSGVYADALIFVKSIEDLTPAKTTIIVKDVTEGTTRYKYKVKHDLTRRVHFGPHAGYIMHPNPVHRSYGYGFITRADEIELGFGCLRGRYIKIAAYTDNKVTKLQGTSSLRAQGDFVMYQYTYSADSTFQYRKKFDKSGIRVYLEGKFSIWGKLDWGLVGGIGLGTYGFISRTYFMYNGGVYIGF